MIKNAIGLLLGILVCYGLASAQEPTTGSNSSNLFQQAEGLFHEGNIVEARLLYERVLNVQPDDPSVAKATFRIGQIDFRKKSYTSALRSFQYFIDTFPGSSLSYHARLKIGQCYYWLEQYAEAEPLFKETLQANPDLSQKWQAYAYLGLLEEKKTNFTQAIENLREVYLKSVDPGLRQFVIQEMETIVKDKMDSRTLASLARRLGKQYPAELALQRLIDDYRSHRDLANYQAALVEFIGLFPEHPLRPAYQKSIEMLKANPQRVLRLAAVLPLSGRRALVGQQVLQGIQMAFNQLTRNEKSQVELVVKDSGLRRSVEHVVEELAMDPNVVGIIGPVLSKDLENVADLVDRYQLPAFSPTASASGLAEKSSFVFRNALTKEAQATFLARHAVNSLNLYRFVVIYPEDKYGTTMKEVFEKEIKSLGGHIVDALSYAQDQNDFRELIFKIGGLSDDRLKSQISGYMENGLEPPPLDDKGVISRPLIDGGLFADDEVEGLRVSMELNYDAIFIPGYYDKVGLLVPQLEFYNIEDVLLIGGNGWNSQELVDNARNYMKSVLFVDGFFGESDDPTVQRFVQKYRSSFGEDPTIISAQSYDTARIMIRTVMEGAANRQDVRTKLSEVKQFPGVTGTIDILDNGETEKQLVRLTVDHGLIVPVAEKLVEPEFQEESSPEEEEEPVSGG